MNARTAAELIEAGQTEEAHRILVDLLNENPDDPFALKLAGDIHARAEHFGMAIAFYRRALEAAPNKPHIINNLGMALEGLQRNKDAREQFLRAIRLAPEMVNAISNLGTCCLQEGDHAGALQWAEKALKLDPEHRGARTVAGFCNLALGNWADGWPGVSAALGGKFRRPIDFGLPMWDGQEGRVLVYPEQGIGDEIMYASCIPDLQRSVLEVGLMCDPRLARIFDRSFTGNIRIFGAPRTDLSWFDRDEWTHVLPIGELPRFFRPSPKACPGTPYLKADPDLVRMYRTLQKRGDDRPTIGVCWSGGKPLTGGKKRALGVENLRPLIERYTADWYSLEYKSEAKDQIEAAGLPITHHHFAVGKGADYDHTLAYAAALDYVVGVDTAVHHALGAIGKPSIVLLHERPTWIHAAMHGDGIPWYRSMRLFRQKDGEGWAKTVARFSLPGLELAEAA